MTKTDSTEVKVLSSRSISVIMTKAFRVACDNVSGYENASFSNNCGMTFHVNKDYMSMALIEYNLLRKKLVSYVEYAIKTRKCGHSAHFDVYFNSNTDITISCYLNCDRTTTTTSEVACGRITNEVYDLLKATRL